MLALSRSQASQFSPLVGFIFKPGCAERDRTALRTGGSLVLSSLVALSICSAAGIRNLPSSSYSPQPFSFWLQLLPNGDQACGGAPWPSLKGLWLFWPVSGPQQWGRYVLPHGGIFLISLCSELGFSELAFVPVCLGMGRCAPLLQRQSRGEEVLLFLSGWTEFAFFRDLEFGTVNMAQPGSLLHLNKTIGFKPFVSCITLQKTPN